jgi:hypothetical protein
VRREHVVRAGTETMGCPKYRTTETCESVGFCVPSGQPCCHDCTAEILDKPVWIGYTKRGSPQFSPHWRALYRKDCGPLAGYGVRAAIVALCVFRVGRAGSAASPPCVGLVGVLGLIGVDVYASARDSSNRVF